MLTLALIAALFGQVGDCGPGKDCVSKSFQPSPCYATGSLPACGTTNKGQVRCDSTQNCLVACFNSAWTCVASGGSSGPTAAAGWFTDGGSTATLPQTLRVEVGSGGIIVDGGVLTLLGDLTSYNSVRTYDSSNLTNNFRISTYNGTTSFEQNGTGMALFSHPSQLATWVYSIVTNGSLSSTTFVKSTGVATGSLPTCNAGALGQIETDTTISRPRFCDGSQHVYPVGNISGFFPGQATITPADNITIAVQRMYSGGNVQRLAYASLLAGTMPAAQTFTMDVYDNTTSTVKCTSSAIACNVATIGSIDCGNTSYAEADDLRIRVHCSTCTTCPMLQINAEYR